MVSDELWAAAGMAAEGGRLCVRCIERRLGRYLQPEDFLGLPINEPSNYSSPLLVSRQTCRTRHVETGYRVPVAFNISRSRHRRSIYEFSQLDPG
jgi:hypothetical protein